MEHKKQTHHLQRRHHASEHQGLRSHRGLRGLIEKQEDSMHAHSVVTAAGPAVDAEGELAHSIFQQRVGVVNARDALHSTVSGCAKRGLDMTAVPTSTQHYGGCVNRDVDGSFFLIHGNGYAWSDGYAWSGDYAWSGSYAWSGRYAWSAPTMSINDWVPQE